MLIIITLFSLNFLILDFIYIYTMYFALVKIKQIYQVRRHPPKTNYFIHTNLIVE